MRTLRLFVTGILTALGVPSLSWSQEYPAREIRSVCNFTPGSGADIIVRYYSDRLAKLAGKAVVVENKPGAQGLLATDFVAKSRPDGYTIMITPGSSTLATAPHIFKQIPFDPVRDFAAVTTIITLAFVIAVDASKPIQSIPELVSHLKSKQGHGLYGTGSKALQDEDGA
jgi:tripartite-type tricarboxylate transporter receptor subunit TctC